MVEKTNVLDTDVLPKYRYLYSLSRIDGGKIKYDRTDGEEVLLVQDSRPSKNDEDGATDYLESIALKEIDELYANEISLSLNSNNYHWTHLTLWRTLNINDADANKKLVKDMFVWVNDIPLIMIANITDYNTELDDIENTDYSTFKIGVSSGCFNKSCVGRRVYSFDETTLEQLAYAQIIRYQYDKGEKQDIVILLLKTDDVSHFTQNKIISTSELIRFGTRVGNDTYNNFALEDDNKPTDRCQILWDTGHTATGINVVGSKLYGKENSLIEPGSKTSYYQTFSTSYDIKIRDNVSDETLLGRIARDQRFYLLQTRFFDNIPNNNISAVKGGAYFCSEGDNNYLYSSTVPINRLGVYHPGFQKHIVNEGKITRLKNYPDSLIIFGQHFTKTIGVNFVQNAGSSDLGEYIVQFLPSQLITSRIGCLKNLGQADIDKFEIILTNENKIALFDGYKYNKNMAENIQNLVNKMGPRTLLIWNPTRGLLVYSSPKQSGEM